VDTLAYVEDASSVDDGNAQYFAVYGCACCVRHEEQLSSPSVPCLEILKAPRQAYLYHHLVLWSSQAWVGWILQPLPLEHLFLSI